MNKSERKKSESIGIPKRESKVKMPSRKDRVSSCSSSSSTASSPASDISTFSRQQRNLAEKQRRDKLNGYINELASLVPLVSHSSKKLDKTSVLRLAAAHLRLYHSSLNGRNGNSKVSWRPNLLNTESLNELLKVIEGFLVVTTISGKVLFASKLVENYLGHQDIELIGHSIFYFIHPDDHAHIKTEWKKVTNFLNSKQTDSDDRNSVRCSFCARMRERCQPRSEVVNYQLMRFTCSYSNHDTLSTSSKSTVTRSRLPVSELDSGVLKLFIQAINVNPFDELSLTEAFQDEYVTQHVASGKIIYADHRISTITGHLPHEVIGMVAYEYIFREDVPFAQFAQKLMFSSSNGSGMIVYRLTSRDGNAVYLKSIGHLQYEKSSTKISHFVCVNKLMSQAEGKEELKKFKERYSPRISELCGFTSEHMASIEMTEAMPETNSLELVPGIDPPQTLKHRTCADEHYLDYHNVDSLNLPHQSLCAIENSRANYNFNAVQDMSTFTLPNGSDIEWQVSEDGQRYASDVQNVKLVNNCLPSICEFDNQDIPIVKHSNPISHTISHESSGVHAYRQKRAYDMLANSEPCYERQLKAKHQKCAVGKGKQSIVFGDLKLLEEDCGLMYGNHACLPTFAPSEIIKPEDIFHGESLSELLPVNHGYPLAEIPCINRGNNLWHAQCTSSDAAKNGLSIQEFGGITTDNTNKTAKGTLHDYVP